MRGLLTTSALVTPFLLSAALAQDPPPATPEPTDDQTQTAPLTTEPADDYTDTDQVEPADDPVTEPADDTVTEPIDDTTTEPADATTIEPADDTTMEPVDDTATEPVTDTDAEPVDAAPVPAEPADDDPAAAAPLDEADAPVDDAAAPAAPAPEGETIVREQAQNELRVDWITGTTVYSPQEERIGQISDLIFDQETRAITAAIVNVGGFLGIGAKQMAVRFDELEIDYDAREIRLNLTRDQADEAPEYVFREREEAPAPAPATDTGTMGQPAAPLD